MRAPSGRGCGERISWKGCGEETWLVTSSSSPGRGQLLLEEQQRNVDKDNSAFRKEMSDYDEKQKVKRGKHVRVT